MQHADVEGDVRTGTLFLTYGKLLSEPPTATPEEKPWFFRVDRTKGVPAVKHPPLWILLGSLLSLTTNRDVYIAFRIISVASGMTLILLLFGVARTLINREAAIAAALWSSLSYLLIDYSGNGSFYTLQAALYLVWVWIALRPPSPKRSVLLGLTSGVAYLINYQSIVLLPASAVLEFFQNKRMAKSLLCFSITAIVTLAIMLPFLVRNALLLGDPFAHNLVNATYVYTKAGIQPEVVDGLLRYEGGMPTIKKLLDVLLLYWLPNNAFYIARKLFVLAPIAFVFFCYGAIDQLLSPERRRRLLPVFILFFAHALLSAAWPVTKFRYFVPLLPLVFLLSLEEITTLIRSRTMRRGVLALITLTIIVCSFLTYRSVPTHTYYYDGAITTDPFSGKGEWNYLRDSNLLPPQP